MINSTFAAYLSYCDVLQEFLENWFEFQRSLLEFFIQLDSSALHMAVLDSPGHSVASVWICCWGGPRLRRGVVTGVWSHDSRKLVIWTISMGNIGDRTINEFKSLIVDLRQLPTDLSQIEDLFGYLENSGSYQCRAHVKQIDRLLRVVVYPAPKAMPAIDISITRTSLPTIVIRSGLDALQSFVLHPKFMASDLLTVGCLEELKGNLPVGHQFLDRREFDPWTDVSRHPCAAIYDSLFQCYTA